MSVIVHTGDCLEVLRTLPDCSVDSVVTDPPYGLSFMGKRWDYDVPSEAIWRECLRVLKPGGHLLAFAGTRTQHRMAVRIEDAGFEIRDMIAWVYGSGFPKSLDVSKAIDKAAGAERKVVGTKRGTRGADGTGHEGAMPGKATGIKQTGCDVPITAPATSAAAEWDGWGTALKPAMEPITVARKPLIGTVAENILAHGTGALNIDGCRIETADNLNGGAYAASGTERDDGWGMQRAGAGDYVQPTGRWPANIIHDGSDEVVAAFPQAKGQQGAVGPQHGAKNSINCYGDFGPRDQCEPRGDSGSAARFFYCAKASRKDRNEGLDHFSQATPSEKTGRKDGSVGLNGNANNRGQTANHFANGGSASTNTHPTVKPTALMRYLCRLVTPPGGVVLDPFMGSGSTGKAAVLEGFRFIGIEREAEYCEIARARISSVSILGVAI